LVAAGFEVGYDLFRGLAGVFDFAGDVGFAFGGRSDYDVESAGQGFGEGVEGVVAHDDNADLFGGGVEAALVFFGGPVDELVVVVGDLAVNGHDHYEGDFHGDSGECGMWNSECGLRVVEFEEEGFDGVRGYVQSRPFGRWSSFRSVG
jgi:hypothetical protein